MIILVKTRMTSLELMILHNLNKRYIQSLASSMQYNRAGFMIAKSELENFFSVFRQKIIGQHQFFESPFGKKEIVYADWTASGRAYQPIEEYIQKEIMPFLANTHTETTITGSLMSKAYEEAKVIVKGHVHANSDDVLVFCGSGMTGAVNKLQRILGLKIPERIVDRKSTRLNSSHRCISYAVFCLKKKIKFTDGRARRLSGGYHAQMGYLPLISPSHSIHDVF